MAKPADEPLHTITTVAARTGITVMALRIWESRYGWPRPLRAPNDHRRYPESVVCVLERVHQELERGRTIGELLRDPWWQAVFERNHLPTVEKRTVPTPTWSSIPLPRTALGLQVRDTLQRALETADTRMTHWAQAMGQQLHPGEREQAVTAVLRHWHQGGAHPLEIANVKNDSQPAAKITAPDRA